MQQRSFPELRMLGVRLKKIRVALQDRTRIPLDEFRFMSQRLGLREAKLLRELSLRMLLEVAFRLLESIGVLLPVHHLSDHQGGVLLGEPSSRETLRVGTTNPNTEL